MNSEQEALMKFAMTFLGIANEKRFARLRSFGWANEVDRGEKTGRRYCFVAFNDEEGVSVTFRKFPGEEPERYSQGETHSDKNRVLPLQGQ